MVVVVMVMMAMMVVRMMLVVVVMRVMVNKNNDYNSRSSNVPTHHKQRKHSTARTQRGSCLRKAMVVSLTSAVDTNIDTAPGGYQLANC